MPNLLRLYSDDQNAVFNGIFNNPLILEPNSKLALVNLALQLDNEEISLTPSNNRITYSIQSGYETDIFLKEDIFNKSNIQELITEIQNKLNASSKVLYSSDGKTIQNNNYLGLCWKAEELNQKINIQYKYAMWGEHTDLNKIAPTISRSSTGIYKCNLATDNTTEFINNILCKAFIGRGNSLIRMKLGKLQKVPNAYQQGLNSQGFIIGLSTTDLEQINNIDFGPINVNYGLGLSFNSNDNVSYYTQKGIDLFEETTVRPNIDNINQTNQPYLELAINGNFIDYNVYQLNTSNETIKYTIKREPYDNTTKLYPFVVFHSDENYLETIGLRTLISPFEEFTNNYLVEDEFSLGATKVPTQRKTRRNIFLEYESQILASFLGFNQKKIEINNVVEYNFVSDNQLKFLVEIDNLLVELLNLSCNSYDSRDEQRNNILSVIPKKTIEDGLVYQSNYPIYIELGNKFPINLQNLKIRIINEDYSSINVIGSSSLTLLVD